MTSILIQESPRVIAGGRFTFSTLKGVALFLGLPWLRPIPTREDPFGIYETARIGLLVFRVLATIA